MSEADVRAAFSNQVAYCNANGAPVTAAVVAAIAKALDPASLFGARVLGWTGKPLADALPLRCAGGSMRFTSQVSYRSSRPPMQGGPARQKPTPPLPR